MVIILHLVDIKKAVHLKESSTINNGFFDSN